MDTSLERHNTSPVRTENITSRSKVVKYKALFFPVRSKHAEGVDIMLTRDASCKTGNQRSESEYVYNNYLIITDLKDLIISLGTLLRERKFVVESVLRNFCIFL